MDERGYTTVRVPLNFQKKIQVSSIGLGFLNLTSQLKSADFIDFCMQLGNRENRSTQRGKTKMVHFGYTVLIRRSVYIQFSTLAKIHTTTAREPSMYV